MTLYFINTGQISCRKREHLAVNVPVMKVTQTLIPAEVIRYYWSHSGAKKWYSGSGRNKNSRNIKSDVCVYCGECFRTVEIFAYWRLLTFSCFIQTDRRTRSTPHAARRTLSDSEELWSSCAAVEDLGVNIDSCRWCHWDNR